MTTTSKSLRAAKTALDAKAAEVRYAEHRARVALDNLVWKTARCRKLDSMETARLLSAVHDGRVILDPKEVAREVEILISTSRLHEDCKDHVREYGSITYRSDPATGYEIGTHLCEGCARPLHCGGVARNHEYVTLGVDECNAKGIYHAGNCFHVSRCKHCGDVASVDSSD